MIIACVLLILVCARIQVQLEGEQNKGGFINSSTCMQVPRSISEEKTLGLEWELNPQPHISGVML